MMNKIISEKVPGILLVLLIWALIIPVNGQIKGKLAGIYKQGRIRIEPDPDFGKTTDWNSLYIDSASDMLRLPDGSFFVISGDDQLYKFAPDGEFSGRFSQKGQGPGDLYHPVSLSLLDDRYIVVGEYATSRRISLFDLSGQFIKIVKTSKAAFSVTALKNGKIVYLSHQYGPSKNNSQEVLKSVCCIDIQTGDEKIITTIKTEGRNIRLKSGIRFSSTEGTGNVYLSRTKEGNLLVGDSCSPELKIYSPQGEHLRSFRLQMEPCPVSSEYLKKYRDAAVQSLRERSEAAGMAEELQKASFDPLFDKFLPYFKKIIVDSEGNILVFRKTDCVESCSPVFQAYSHNGSLIEEVIIEPGSYDIPISSLDQNIFLTPEALFGLFPHKNIIDEPLRIIKVSLK